MGLSAFNRMRERKLAEEAKKIVQYGEKPVEEKTEKKTKITKKATE